MANFIKRDVLMILLLSVFTFGIYYLYWIVATKEELNRVGADIPTAWCLIIPFVNFYFWYRYAQGYVKIVKQKADDSPDVLVYFFIGAFIPLIKIIIFQDGFNRNLG
jgi:hypothetical protein